MIRSLYKWWRSVDQGIATAIMILFFCSLILVNISSPSVAARIGVNELYFVKKQLIFLNVAFAIIISISFMDKVSIRRLSILGCAFAIILLIATYFIGYEVKGARRWVNVMGFSMQASEFLRPFLWVLVAFIISQKEYSSKFPSFLILGALYITVAGLIIIQPDFGTLMLISCVIAAQLFVAGISLIWVGIIICCGILTIAACYMIFPHVSQRIDKFLDFANTENYQVTKSLQAFYNGGLYGTGPGEGVIKKSLPDSHTDFVFAVIGEEFGSLICVFICCTFAYIVIKGIIFAMKEEDIFKKLSLTGLLCQIGLQSIINMGVAVRIFPTKGMTLPIISCGGCSVLSMGVVFGILLAFTRSSINATYSIRKKLAI